MKVLAVDIEQHLAEGLELLHRGGIAVDKRPRSAIGVDYAPQQAFAVLVEGLLLEPVVHRRHGGDVEFGAELRAFRAISNQL